MIYGVCVCVETIACMNSSSLQNFSIKFKDYWDCEILYPFTYMCWMLWCAQKLNNSIMFVTNDTWDFDKAMFSTMHLAEEGV